MTGLPVQAGVRLVGGGRMRTCCRRMLGAMLCWSALQLTAAGLAEDGDRAEAYAPVAAGLIVPR